MLNVVLVAFGGAAGSVMRHFVNVAALRTFGSGFPAGTLAVNIAGSFLMGALVEFLALRFNGSPQLRLLLATGFLGGFTTFSAFSLDFAVLWERGEVATAIGYVTVSVLASLAALFGGLALVRAIA